MESDVVRQEVSRSYAAAVTARSGCCGGKCEVVDPEGVVAQWAGYSSEDLDRLAQGGSFGCGNPLGFTQVEPGQVVLDLGSGAGLDLLIAAARVGSAGRVIGVDMTDEMLAVARANLERAGLTNVELRRGIIEELPVEDASVDWVISNCVINLSPEKDRVFAEIFRVLRPGGRISISDIVAQDLPEVVRRNRALHSACLAGAIPEQDYRQGLVEAGLEGVEVRQRQVYDKEQLSCIGAALQDLAPDLVDTLQGKVWSALFCAHRPN